MPPRGGSMSLSLSNRQTRFSPRCRRVSIWTSLSLVFPRLWVCMRCTARCQKIRAPRQRSVTEARGPWFIFRPALFEVVLPNSP